MLASRNNQILLGLLIITLNSFSLKGQTEFKSDGIVIPSFTTTQRNQITAVDGQCIYNLSTNYVECYDGTQWRSSASNVAQPWFVNGPTVYLAFDQRVGIGTSAAAASLQIDAPTGVDPFRARVASATKLRVHNNGSVSVGSSSSGSDNGLYVLGNAGIGTTNPNAKMEISSNDWQLSLNNINTGGEDWYIGSSSNSWNAGGGKFILSKTNSSGAAALVVDNSNNVGISTLSPSTKLHVSGGSDVNAMSGGFITIGTNSGSHLAMDNNEIMARNNGAVSTLALNAEGGQVTVNSGGTRDSDAMRIRGRVFFDNGGNSGMRITATNSTPTNALLEPTLFEEGLVGQSGRPFWRIYSREFYASATSEYRTYSDRNLKDNIIPIKNALDKIKSLEGVSYSLTKSPLKKRVRPLTKQEKYIEENQLGFIAQDVAKVLPQLVSKDESSGLHTVGYLGVIPVLVEAIKEQQSKIEILEDELKLLRNNEASYQNESILESRLEKIENLLLQKN